MNKDLVEPKLREITQKIVARLKPERVILFGSWAWGEPGPDSDIDLLIIENSKKSRSERERELREFLFASAVAADILVYTPEEIEEKINHDRNLFLEDIVRNGRTLFSRREYDVHTTNEPAEVIMP